VEIKDTMRDGKLPSADGEIHSGQELVVPLLERCLKWCDIVEEKYDAPHKLGKMLISTGKERLTNDSKTCMTN
jgi:hypothetical protein